MLRLVQDEIVEIETSDINVLREIFSFVRVSQHVRIAIISASSSREEFWEMSSSINLASLLLKNDLIPKVVNLGLFAIDNLCRKGELLAHILSLLS